MFKDDLTRIRHILDAARECASFLAGMSIKDLNTNRMLNLSIVRLLEIIGEAARGISPQLKEKYPDIPWRKMAGIRDRLIHGYFDVDMEIVWKTVKEDIPGLINLLDKILDKEKGEE